MREDQEVRGQGGGERESRDFRSHSPTQFLLYFLLDPSNILFGYYPIFY